MRHVFLVAVLSIISVASGYAQIEKSVSTQAVTADEKKKLEDSLQGWKFGGMGGITFSQAAFVNWSAGGTNSIAFLFNARMYADYKKEKHLLQNWLAAEYGFQIQKGQGLVKNADRWEIFSKYGYQVSKKLYVAEYIDIRSQFNKTLFGNTDSAISRFASPLTIEGAIGIDWVPNPYFSLFVSPVASKTIFVSDDPIAATGTYGNIPPKKVRQELGAVLLATYKQDVCKNINIASILKVYKDYLKGPAQNIDVDWQTTIGFKVNKYISASIFTHLIWDYDVLFKNPDTGLDTDHKLQFRDVIGIGVNYNSNWFKTRDVKAKQL
jgi:Protein of unknown function (DUF3078)